MDGGTRFWRNGSLVLLFLAIFGVAGLVDALETIPAGLWQGNLRYPGLESSLVVRLAQQQGEMLRVVVLLPDQTEREFAAEAVVVDGSALRFSVASLRAEFDGVYDRLHDTWTAQWTQNGRTQAITFVRIERIEKQARPQTPKPPFPYDVIEVTYENPSALARIAGTLTVPRGGGPFPAAMILSGGGAQDRDGTMLRHKPYLVLADYLTRRGVAVLRVDDRGVGASTGERENATSADFARDALAGVAYLREVAKVDKHRIGLIGHSEGGLIAALAAAESPDVAFVVMLASPGLPGVEYHLQYEASTSRALGLSEAAIAAKYRWQEKIVKLVASEREAADVERELRSLLRRMDPDLPAARVDAAIRRFLSSWFRFSVRHDPCKTLRQVKCPVLAMFGEKDVQVPPDRNEQAIRGVLSEKGANGSTVERLTGLNHFFQTCVTGSPTEYGRIDETIAPSALAKISDWVIARCRR